MRSQRYEEDGLVFLDFPGKFRLVASWNMGLIDGMGCHMFSLANFVLSIVHDNHIQLRKHLKIDAWGPPSWYKSLVLDKVLTDEIKLKVTTQVHGSLEGSFILATTPVNYDNCESIYTISLVFWLAKYFHYSIIASPLVHNPGHASINQAYILVPPWAHTRGLRNTEFSVNLNKLNDTNGFVQYTGISNFGYVGNVIYNRNKDIEEIINNTETF